MKRIADTLLGALVQAMPGRIPAAPCGSVRVAIFGGHDQATGQRFVCSDFSTGGTGGQPDARRRGFARNRHRQHDEHAGRIARIELPDPRALATGCGADSAGRRPDRGGLGIEREIEILRGEVTMTLREDRHRTRPWGLHGGRPAPRARARSRVRRGHVRTFRRKACSRYPPAIASAAGLPAAPAMAIRSSAIRARRTTSSTARSADVPRATTTALSSEMTRRRPRATQRKRDELRAEHGPINWIYDRGEQGRT